MIRPLARTKAPVTQGHNAFDPKSVVSARMSDARTASSLIRRSRNSDLRADGLTGVTLFRSDWWVVGQFGSAAMMRKPVMISGSMATAVSAWLTHGWSSCS
jgi:hypothetical protein